MSERPHAAVGEIVVTHRIRTFITESLKLDTPAELHRSFIRFIAEYGFAVGAYAVLVRDFKRLDLRTGLIAENFPQDLVDRYFREDWQKIDPLAEAALLRDSPFRWFEIQQAKDLTTEQRRFFETLRNAGFIDGVAVPVFVRYGDIACFLLSFPERKFELTHTEMYEIQLLCQFMHWRHSQLTCKEEVPKLSAREKEIARWIALGKTNADIARILGVSTYTVDTTVRRYFAKLGVNNRVEAALKSVSQRLVYL